MLRWPTHQISVGPGIVHVVSGVVIETLDLRDEIVPLCLYRDLDDSFALEVGSQVRV